MREYLDIIIRDRGIVGVIEFFQNANDGIKLAERETKALAEFLEKFVVPPSKGE